MFFMFHVKTIVSKYDKVPVRELKRIKSHVQFPCMLLPLIRKFIGIDDFLMDQKGS